MAKQGLEADGLATALFFVEPARLKPRFAFEYVVVRDDLSLDCSPGLADQVFAAQEQPA